MLNCQIALSKSPHPVIIGKNPGFRALFLARRNEFCFLVKISGCWLLPEKFSFCPKNNGFARIWGVAAAPSSPLARRLWIVHVSCQVGRGSGGLNLGPGALGSPFWAWPGFQLHRK